MQIELWITDQSLAYDVHGLLTSFFPGARVRTTGPAAEGEDAPEEAPARPAGDEGKAGPEEAPAVRIRIEDVPEGFSIRSEVPEKETAQAMIPAGPDRHERKDELKRGLYRLLAGQTGKTLPWGTLTGIRPVKIPMALLEEGRTEEEIRDHLKSTYYMSDRKADLSIEIAQRERALLARAEEPDGWSLYAGIPFCPTRCAYCSFTAYPIKAWAGRTGEYLDALEKEIAFTAELFAGRPLKTIYVGGGTPTSLSAEELARLCGALRERFDLSHLLEWTVEAGRPDSITPDKLAALKAAGVSRISVNPQTMKEETLRLIGRRHTVEQVREAFRMTREAGFDDINMDLILGLPEETADDVARTMEEIAKLGPDNVTIHSLAIKRAARLRTEEASFAGLHMENSDELMDYAARACRDMGLAPYYLYRQKNMAGNQENVGYARPGCEGLYNILIMEERQPIAALGAGAVTKALFPDGRIARAENVKDVDRYISHIDEMIERKRALFEEGKGRS